VGWQDAPLVTATIVNEGWKNAPLVNQGASPSGSLPTLDSTEPLTDTTQFGSTPREELGREILETTTDFTALLDVGATIATGVVSSISMGAVAAAALAFGADDEWTASQLEGWTQTFTWMPKGEKGKKLLEAIAVPLMELEETVDDFSFETADGDPWAATMIKTSLLAVAELALPTKGSIKAMRTGMVLRKQAAEMKKMAFELGVTVRQNDLASSVVALAERLTPDQRAQNMPYLREQLQKASETAIANKNKLYETAIKTETYVNSRSVNSLVSGMRSKLDQTYDLDEMPRVAKVFRKLSFDTGPRPSVVLESAGIPEKLPPVVVNLRKFEDVRKKLNNEIKDAKVNKPSEASALIIIKKDMDDFLGNELRQTTIDAGKSAISGDMSGVQAYRDARKATADWYKTFNEDKVIRGFIKDKATAETMAAWVLGSSATGVAAKREAATVINRMKAALGDNHPAIKGIRQDFLYEVASPLLHPDGPNFNTFVRNYELMIDRNPSIVKALDLDMGDFKELHNLARLQKTLPHNDASLKDVFKRVTTIVARLTVGHGIAKAGVKVNLMRDALNMIGQADRVSQKSMFYELAGLKYGETLLPAGRPLAASFIAGAALTEINDAREQIQP